MGPQVTEWQQAWREDVRLPTGQEIIEALFQRQPPIVWYRLADFQDVSMRMIAERLLAVQPLSPSAHSSGLNGPPSALSDRRAGYQQMTYMEGEVGQLIRGKLTLHLPAVRADCRHHVYVSPASPHGTLDLVRTLQSIFEKTNQKLTYTEEASQLRYCEHMLVLLTSETWTRGEDSDEFARDSCKAMRAGVHRLLVHEVVGARLEDNATRHAISFEDIIGATPRHLFNAKLYNEIAMNMGGGEWREAGLAKMVRQLCKGSGARHDWRVEPEQDDESMSSAEEQSDDKSADEGEGPRVDSSWWGVLWWPCRLCGLLSSRLICLLSVESPSEDAKVAGVPTAFRSRGGRLIERELSESARLSERL